MSMRIVFMGSPEFSTLTLKALVDAGHDVVCVYSQPPRPAGRGKTLRKTPVHALADELGIDVRTPVSLKGEAEQAAFAALGADIGVVVAYGLLLPRAVLDAPKHGCVNLHGSLLPRWRGAAPIQRAVMAGDARTGVQVMQMEAGLDTGPVMLSAEAAIFPRDTSADLHDRLAAMGAELMIEALAAIEAGTAVFTPQSEDGVTYAHKISSEEARIDWTRSGEEVSAHIRGLSPFPGAWFELEDAEGSKRIKVLGAVCAPDESGEPGLVLDDELLIGCGSGAVRLLRLQKAGKGAMDADVFLRGTPINKGQRLS